MTDVRIDPCTNTAGDRLIRTLEAHGLTARSGTDLPTGTDMVTVDIVGGPEIWIADRTGRTDSPIAAHPGWVAFYRPHADLSDEGEAEIYRSEGAGGFTPDTAALVVAVVQCAAARSLTPA
ncbi:hypothetical protein EES39_38400 [Streptomyces sp. ADI92-24]|uniref:hypothetical protein n=1 Tax=Streptomyces sp. ADI92-24 TaxID=1522756 RepID=UPI000F54E751|nr:hypothetical protein [Streptomyces sp. ADI92-24]RPK32537.1 hypothetical protein EES39_38400 [Streptomyces sp. ADI92-24]